MPLVGYSLNFIIGFSGETEEEQLDNIGQEYLVLVDEVNSEGAIARSYMHTPEVDE